jgi:hypothetical protein
MGEGGEPVTLPALDDMRRHFDRVATETGNAAGYLAVSRAVLRVPDYERRWEGSDCREALRFSFDGAHKAFAVTLAGLQRQAGYPPEACSQAQDCPQPTRTCRG